MANYDSTLDLCFAALCDPTRRMIIERLARGAATTSELADPHEMALPSFMQHLKKLEAAGLITTEKKGRTRICQLAPGAFTPAQNWLTEQGTIWDRRLDQLDTYVSNLMKERNK